MKHHWTVTELIETFTLTSGELTLMTGMTAHNRLGFAVLLKFFQQEARFPSQPAEVPQTIIDYLAQQLDVSPAAYQQYNLQGRSINDQRRRIRQWFGFRPYTAADREALITWLCDAVLAQNQKTERLLDSVYQRLRAWRIEPPTSLQVECLIRSAQHRYETALFSRVVAQLPAATRRALGNLLQARSPRRDRSTPTQLRRIAR